MDDEARETATMDAAGVRFTIPTAPPVAELLVNKLVALYPFGTVQYEATETKTREATECHVVEVRGDAEDSKTYVDLGRVPVPWDQPRRELRKANPEAPWVLGTIVKRDVAYFLNPPRPSDIRRAQGALADFLADRRAAREAAAAEAAAAAQEQAAAPASSAPAKRAAKRGTARER